MKKKENRDRVEKLNKKWWWRTLKVVYIFVWLFSLLMMGAFSIESMPSTHTSSYDITITWF